MWWSFERWKMRVGRDRARAIIWLSVALMGPLPACGEGDDSPVSKTVYTEACEQDYPPNLYAKIIDYGACNTTN